MPLNHSSIPFNPFGVEEYFDSCHAFVKGLESLSIEKQLIIINYFIGKLSGYASANNAQLDALIATLDTTFPCMLHKLTQQEIHSVRDILETKLSYLSEVFLRQEKNNLMGRMVQAGGRANQSYLYADLQPS